MKPNELVDFKEIALYDYYTMFTAIWLGALVTVKKGSKPDYQVQQKKFKNEIAILSKLRYPYIVSFLGAYQGPEDLFIVTDYMPGDSLYNLLHVKNQVLDPKKMLLFSKQIAAGMNYLHKRVPLVIHRNLNSSNIMVTEELTQCRIANFEYAITKEMAIIVGNPASMAPEMMLGNIYNEKIDVYAFAMVLYEMGSRKLPFSDVVSTAIYKKSC